MIPRPEGFTDYLLTHGEAEATLTLHPSSGKLSSRESELVDRAFKLGVKAGRELAAKPWPGQGRMR